MKSPQPTHEGRWSADDVFALADQAANEILPDLDRFCVLVDMIASPIHRRDGAWPRRWYKEARVLTDVLAIGIERDNALTSLAIDRAACGDTRAFDELVGAVDDPHFRWAACEKAAFALAPLGTGVDRPGLDRPWFLPMWQYEDLTGTYSRDDHLWPVRGLTRDERERLADRLLAMVIADAANIPEASRSCLIACATHSADRGNLDQARHVFRFLEDSPEEQIYVREAIAEELIRQKRFAEAEQLVRHCTRPWLEVEVHTAHGVVLSRAGNEAAADAAFARARGAATRLVAEYKSLSPRERKAAFYGTINMVGRSLVELAKALIGAGRADQAERLTDLVLDNWRHPWRHQVLTLIVENLVKHGDLDRAVAVAMEERTSERSRKLLTEVAAALEESGRLEDAMKLIETKIGPSKGFKGLAAWLDRHGQLMVRTGRLDELFRRSAFMRGRRFRDALRRVAVALAEGGHVDHALSRVERMDQPAYAAQTMAIVAARLAHEGGNPERAEAVAMGIRSAHFRADALIGVMSALMAAKRSPDLERVADLAVRSAMKIGLPSRRAYRLFEIGIRLEWARRKVAMAPSPAPCS